MTSIRLGWPQTKERCSKKREGEGPSRGLFICTALLAASLSACASVPRQHSARRGVLEGRVASRSIASTPSSAAKRAEVSKQLETKQAGASVEASGAAPSAADARSSEVAIRKLRPLLAKWQWPLDQIQITSNFGHRGKDFHEGIDLRAAQGTNVYAVDAGKVIYAGEKISGYGRLIVVRHAGGLASVYAHNSELRVRVGEHVDQGQKIAISGNTGRSSGPHLHFEVRYGVLALDPLKILPENDRVRLTRAAPRRPVSATAGHRVAHRKISSHSKRKKRKHIVSRQG